MVFMWRGLALCSLLGIALVSGACDGNSGQKAENEKRELRGQTVSEERVVPPFEGVVVPKKGILKIAKGKHGPARITGPKNYIAALELRSEKKKVGDREVSVLVVELPLRIVPPGPEIELTTPEMIYVETGGGARVELGDFSSSYLQLLTKEGGRIDLAPSAFARVDATTGDASQILAPEVMVEEAHLTARGPSRLILGEVARVKRNTLPPSRVAYQGKPEVLK